MAFLLSLIEGSCKFIRAFVDKQLILSQLTGCFSCTMEGGFRIYNVEPLSEKARVGEFVWEKYPHSPWIY